MIELEQERNDIIQWLKDTDYIPIKHYLGEYQQDDLTYVKYLDERRVKKARLKEIDYLLGK